MVSALSGALPLLGISDQKKKKCWYEIQGHSGISIFHSTLISYMQKKHLLNHATANWKSNSSVMFFKCWWRCTDVIVGNDKRRGVFIVKTLATTAFEMSRLTKLLKIPIIAIVKTHYIVFACFYQRKGASTFVKQRSFMAGLQIKT